MEGTQLHKLITGLAVLAVAAPVSALAQSALDGTWKTDPHSMTWSGKPTSYTLAKGVFSCASCVPAEKVKADGKPQPYVGNPFVNSLAVTVVDDHTVRAVGAQNGKQMGVQVFKVSADGKTLTVDFSGNARNPGGAPFSTSRTYTRLTAAPAGAHAMSGTWKRTAMTAMSGDAGMNTFKVEGTMLHWSSPGGESYVAGFDGKPYPLKGDPGADSVTLTKVSAAKIVETDWLKGKKVDTTTWSVSPSGKTLTILDNDPETGLVTTAKAMKQ